MPDADAAIDIGGMLRRLRRQADLSQRELAAKAGVPKSTVARIEAGEAANPRFRTVERLVQAADGVVVAGLSGAVADVVPPPQLPHDGWADEAGRRYPAHLDAWEVREPRDWPGAWWAEWYRLPPERCPLRIPAFTYQRNREYRDQRRWGEEIRRTFRVRRVTSAGLPETSWRFVAELPDGALIGALRAHERSPHLCFGDEPGDEREVVLDGVLVAAEYRRLGVGRRLVERLVQEMDQAGIQTSYAFADALGSHLLFACGYRIERRAWTLRLDRAVGPRS
ncbi:GNAT family N-acetyltransferase [Micromonospora sp. WMMA1363]|uniref:GNAT family N-acetyltransferase n=1 Tax=Micromonospora sp. WMMA1363 TaxID=3053985 RepID=UPI00259D0D27|nr:GNAT family N-acetyltransferase [Micromonospora sp. WMMA1363]MDM4722223.1 GNAT family N-acetyltransferase [Micromonospora sp. WMMA1363]